MHDLLLQSVNCGGGAAGPATNCISLAGITESRVSTRLSLLCVAAVIPVESGEIQSSFPLVRRGLT